MDTAAFRYYVKGRDLAAVPDIIPTINPCISTTER